MMHFNSKATPTNDIYYSCHIEAVSRTCRISVFDLFIISLGGELTTKYVLEHVAIDLASDR